jgi:2-(1,2-epoxy-1,2-dihydrophenyl)acetyl-CoA isomerase
VTDVVLDIDDGIARLTLNRPAALNAYNLSLARELRAAVAAVHESDAAALIVRGEGRALCAGGDVREMAASGDPEGYLRELTTDVHAALADLRRLPVPVIARVHGAVAGGGLGLVLAADIVVASEPATFTAAYGAIGLSPDCGVTALLPGVVGAARARAFLVGGRRIDAATALAWGLVADVVPAEALDAAVAGAVAAALAAGREATAATKTLLDAEAASFDERLNREADSIATLAGSSASERIAAFAAR